MATAHANVLPAAADSPPLAKSSLSRPLLNDASLLVHSLSYSSCSSAGDEDDDSDMEFLAPWFAVCAVVGLRRRDGSPWQRRHHIVTACLLFFQGAASIVASLALNPADFIGPSVAHVSLRVRLFLVLISIPAIFSGVIYVLTGRLFQSSESGLRSAFGALFDRRHHALMRVTRIEFFRAVKSVYVPVLLGLAATLVICAIVFGASFLAPSIRAWHISESTMGLVIFGGVLMAIQALYSIFAIFVCISTVVISTQSHIASVGRVREMIEKQSVFEEMAPLIAARDHESAANASHNPSSDGNDNGDADIDDTTRTVAFALDAISRNRRHLLALNEALSAVLLATVLLVSITSLGQLIWFLSRAFSANVDLISYDYANAFFGAFFALLLLLLLFQIARVSRAGELCVTHFATQCHALIEARRQRMAWATQLLVTTREADFATVGGVNVSMASVVQLAYSFGAVVGVLVSKIQ